MRQHSLYEALGGFQEVLRLAHAWHDHVMKDAVVSHAFSHGFHPQHTERLAAYWTEALGGPALYTERYGTEASVVRMHSGNGEHQEMDERAIECFAQSLKDLSIQDAALQRALLDYFTWTTKNTMAAYPHSKTDVPSGLQVPRWSWSGLQQ